MEIEQLATQTDHYHYVEFARSSGIGETKYNSYTDWGLYLEEPVAVSPPEPNTYMVEVPGRNGSLDLTESVTGSVTYQDRKMEFPFLCRKKRSEWNEIYHQVLNGIHGRECQITCSDDPAYYYEGRVTVQKWGADEKMAFPKVTATVRPFKVKKEKQVYSGLLSEKKRAKDALRFQTTYNTASKKAQAIFAEGYTYWDRYTEIEVLAWGYTGYENVTITVYGGDGTYTQSVTSTSGENTWTVEKASATAAGVDWENVRMIEVSPVSNMGMAIKGVLPGKLSITTGKSGKPVIPTIYATTDVTMVTQGQEYSIDGGKLWGNERVTIGENGATLAFEATGTISDTDKVTVTYQEEWL